MKNSRSNAIHSCIIVFTLVFALISCETATDKVKDAEKKVEKEENKLEKANEDLTEARKDSANEYVKYKHETYTKLSENDKRIAEIKEQMKKETQEIRDKYEKNLSILEDKNVKLRKTIEEYKGDNSNWNTFKDNVNKDINNIEKSIMEMSNRNMNKNK